MAGLARVYHSERGRHFWMDLAPTTSPLYTTDRYLRCGNWNGILLRPLRARLAVIGRGRLGPALADALRDRRLRRRRPARPRCRRQPAPTPCCCASPTPRSPVPPRHVVPGVLVAHCSGASPLGVLGAREAFSLHPLMTVTAEGARFAGAGAAIAGSSHRALALAGELAEALGMHAGGDRRSGPRRPTTRPHRSRRTSWSRSRPPPSGCWRLPAPTARCSCRSSGPRSRTGPRSAPSAR